MQGIFGIDGLIQGKSNTLVHWYLKAGTLVTGFLYEGLENVLNDLSNQFVTCVCYEKRN